MIKKVSVRNYIALMVIMFLACPLTAKAETVLFSDIEWEQLNPARGDKSPKAGALWGDRKSAVPAGFLVQFADGFSSPPHIHNVSYRGVVIRGLVHNDDPNAEKMWMPAGSFWTQPQGEIHITAAKGNVNIAYIEIDDGPYLVMPTEESFDSGERPINIDTSNSVWLDHSDVTSSKISYLWGSPQGNQLYGAFLKMPVGFSGDVEADGSIFRAVLIRGQVQYAMPGIKTLEPGSYFSSEGKKTHSLSCFEGEACLFYVQTNGKLDVNEAELS